MKLVLFGTLFSFAFVSKGQNTLDSEGRRHGWWKFTQTEFMISQAVALDGSSIPPPDTSFYEVTLLEGRYEHGVKNGTWYSDLRNLHAIKSEIEFVNDTIVGPIVVYKGIHQLFTGKAEKLSGSVLVKYSAKGNYKRITKKEIVDNYSSLKLAN
jgi:hypothetical protein